MAGTPRTAIRIAGLLPLQTRTDTLQPVITTATAPCLRHLLLGELDVRAADSCESTSADRLFRCRLESRPVLEPPMNLPYMVTHRYFSDWFHASQSDALSGADFDKALADAWTKYQGDFLRRELKASWADIRMRAPEWAEEKYGIAEDRVAERTERRRMAEKETRMRAWAERAAKGDFDDVSFDFGKPPTIRRLRIAPGATCSPLTRFADEELARKPRIIPNAAAQAAAAAEAAAAAKTGTNGSENGSDATLAAVAEAAPPKARTPVPTTVLKASSPEQVILPARPETIVCPSVPPTVATKALIEVRISSRLLHRASDPDLTISRFDRSSELLKVSRDCPFRIRNRISGSTASRGRRSPRQKLRRQHSRRFRRRTASRQP